MQALLFLPTSRPGAKRLPPNMCRFGLNLISACVQRRTFTCARDASNRHATFCACCRHLLHHRRRILHTWSLTLWILRVSVPGEKCPARGSPHSDLYEQSVHKHHPATGACADKQFTREPEQVLAKTHQLKSLAHHACQTCDRMRAHLHRHYMRKNSHGMQKSAPALPHQKRSRKIKRRDPLAPEGQRAAM